MPEKMSRRMTPHSASRSISRSPAKGKGRRKTPSYSPSRSRSPPPRRNGGRRHSSSRSRSRSYSPRYRRRSRSRSSYGSNKRRLGTREQPVQSRCLGVFGLSVHTNEMKIRDLFSKYGRIERIQVVLDAKTGRSRGFCFVYFDQMADAKVAKDGTNALEIDGRRIRVDYSITQRPHTPTPGVYKGQPTRASKREHFNRYREDYRSRNRWSGSPYRDRRRQYDRSRSRSQSRRRSRY